MIVRCGRCKAELEVAGPGEFLCPACGSRNVVRGAASPSQGFAGVGSFGGGGAFEGLGGTAPQAPPPPAPDVRWVSCPNCSYRFVVGEVEEVPCPTCSAALDIREDQVKLAGN